MKKTLLFTLILACMVCTAWRVSGSSVSTTLTASADPVVSAVPADPGVPANPAVSAVTGATTATNSDPKGSPKTETIAVSGACEMCADRIEAAAKSVAGVSKAKWNVRKQQLKVTYDSAQTSIEAICKAIAAVGHDAGAIKAPDEVYDNLHHCCKYR